MPLSNAEKQKRYREKLKSEGRYIYCKEKDRIRHETVRSQLSAKQRKELKERNKVYKQLQRAKEKVHVLNNSNNGNNPSDDPSTSTPFSSRQSLGKARKKLIKSLPTEPAKKFAVLTSVVKSFGLDLKNVSSNGPNKTSRSISNEVKSKIDKFYNDDSVSWQAPGIKDYIIVENDGKKDKKQKRYLMINLKECHMLFLQEFPDIKVSFSKFAELHPAHVLLQKQIPHNVCLCKIHENIRFLLKTLNAHDGHINSEFRGFIDQVVCDQSSEHCMFGECENCPGIDYIKVSSNQLNTKCKWNQWTNSEDTIQKEEVTGTVGDCFEILKSNLPVFLRHTFIKRQQAQHFKELRENLKPNEIVIQLDFSENFSCFEQNEIQSAHWSHNQITVFTAVVWFVQNSEITTSSYAFISNSLNHDKYSVHVFSQNILSDMKTKVNFDSVHFFSDGAASQFKQKYNFCNLTYIDDVAVAWHFFATSHGKGAVDGIGGEVKRKARLAALGGQSISNAQEFVNVVNQISSKINVKYVDKIDIDKIKTTLDKRWNNSLAIPGTHKLHCIKVLEVNHVAYSEYSSSTSWVNHCFFSKNASKACNLSVEIILERYYAVYYDNRFYIGRVLSTSMDENMVTIKFLHEEFPNQYKWPAKNDIATVETKFLFYGPLVLLGNGPFTIPEISHIHQKYKDICKCNQNMR